MIVAANGCVASTTTSIALSNNHFRNPTSPPKPPIRSAPAGTAGLFTRPAREVVTSNRGASRSANSRASAEPPRIKTLLSAGISAKPLSDVPKNTDSYR
ncbi:Uncharacterised protein [Mycobacteroides abscessus subsp. abscessus]|nr:Uncharacterised protein [Mycobacteroides abscessus subsp. abscessus]